MYNNDIVTRSINTVNYIYIYILIFKIWTKYFNGEERY